METYLRPIFAWDSFADWSAGAKAFYYSHGLLLDVSPEDFFGKGLLDRNANYPPHNPLMQVWMALWIGHFDEVFVKFWSPVYLLAMSFYLYVVMARETSRLIALAMIVLFTSSPLLSLHSFEVYSDVPLSVYILFALIMFLFGMRGKHEYWMLMGLYSAEALFTKDEAPFFVLPLLMAAAAFFWQNRGQGICLRKSAVPLFASLFLAVPWFVFKFAHKLGFGADYVTVEFTFRPEMVWKVILLLASLMNFNVFFLFIPLLAILAGRPTKEFILLGMPVLCYASFFILVYTLTVFFSGDLMFQAAVFRNTLTYYPSICLLTFLLLNNLVLKCGGVRSLVSSV
jgi:4-amino-4-deoxy-L-arabinose transferase-like glycosyltransferase